MNKRLMILQYPWLTRQNIATFIALLFHTSGCVGMFTSSKDWFISNTPLNLIIMFGLILWTQRVKNLHFLLFFVTAFATGMITEMIGVNTGSLFGEYEYGSVLGGKINNVPWLIGINWFIVIYCSGVIVSHFHQAMQAKYAAAGQSAPPGMMLFSLIIDGAMLTTFFDYIIEPVAVKLGYWQWLGDGQIPTYNYVCWFAISAVLLLVFRLLRFSKQNHFAVHLFIIQLLFFGILRTYL